MIYNSSVYVKAPNKTLNLDFRQTQLTRAEKDSVTMKIREIYKMNF